MRTPSSLINNLVSRYGINPKDQRELAELLYQLHTSDRLDSQQAQEIVLGAFPVHTRILFRHHLDSLHEPGRQFQDLLDLFPATKNYGVGKQKLIDFFKSNKIGSLDDLLATKTSKLVEIIPSGGFRRLLMQLSQKLNVTIDPDLTSVYQKAYAEYFTDQFEIDTYNDPNPMRGGKSYIKYCKNRALVAAERKLNIVLKGLNTPLKDVLTQEPLEDMDKTGLEVPDVSNLYSSMIKGYAKL